MNSEFSDKINSFLRSDEPKVVCISGGWGVGKTYAWGSILNQSSSKGEVARPKYSYVSMFGAGSIEDIKFSIFQNTIDVNYIGSDPSIESISTAIAFTKREWKKVGSLVSSLPFTKDYNDALIKIGSFLTSNTLVCIDDIERAGDSINISDILGLASILKEQKRCSVVLILNDDALDDDRMAQFNKYLEKVSDINVKYESSCEEICKIPFDLNIEIERYLFECCTSLGLKNIRILNRIKYDYYYLTDNCSGYDLRVFKRLAYSLCLFNCIRYMPLYYPEKEYVFNRLKIIHDAENKNDKYESLLSSYGFYSAQEIDLFICHYVESGTCSKDKLKSLCDDMNASYDVMDKDSRYNDAWLAYHGSFEDNADEVVSLMVSSIRECAKAISPMNLSSSIVLLKELASYEVAIAALNGYISNRDEDYQFWNISDYAFGRSLDVDVVSAFNKKFKELAPAKDLYEVLSRIAEGNGWNEEDIEFLANVKKDEFKYIFRIKTGDEKIKITKGALKFKNVVSGDDRYQKINDTVVEALKDIASQSDINRLRIRSMGVDV